MSLGNGQNSDSTGIGDSQHTATSQELPRRVPFSSPIAIFGKTQEISGLESRNFTPEQTKVTPTPRNRKGKGKAVETPGNLCNTLAPLILTRDDGETILDLSTPELIREYMGSGTALTTNMTVAILLITLVNSLIEKMNKIENRIMAVIREKQTGQRIDRMCTPAETHQAQPNPAPAAIQITNPEGALPPRQQQQAQQQ
ncbi:hypothetical protein L873DRAFT_1790996 [Choiromyces venosus 120613-1]|uniref:Uncharacterized protein n=1 Tax=Choiromyces venosus 120613-1 TaxID=1336337 RepID=A0A3N4JJ80_9PEZI|nr:hypothetical protein L873DRAFT_1790996 [Choiromyces venosus 120613-1]